MSSVEVKSFNNPDEVNTKFDNAKMESLNVGGQRVIRITLEPGWKWSSDVKPVVQTDSCQTKHLGIITAGTVCCKHDDGTEATYTKGDAYSIDPGHDAWVVGDEPAVNLEFSTDSKEFAAWTRGES